MAARRNKSGKKSSKKRTLTPEQLAKMKEGRERAKRARERREGISELEARLRKGARGY